MFLGHRAPQTRGHSCPKRAEAPTGAYSKESSETRAGTRVSGPSGAPDARPPVSQASRGPARGCSCKSLQGTLGTGSQARYKPAAHQGQGSIVLWVACAVGNPGKQNARRNTVSGPPGAPNVGPLVSRASRGPSWSLLERKWRNTRQNACFWVTECPKRGATRVPSEQRPQQGPTRRKCTKCTLRGGKKPRKRGEN